MRLFIPVHKATLFLASSIILFSLFYSVYLLLLRLYWKNIFQKLFIQEKSAVQILYAIGIIFSYVAIAILRITLVSGPIYIILLIFVMWSLVILCYAVINTQERVKQKYETDLSKNIIASWKLHYEKEYNMLVKHYAGKKDNSTDRYSAKFCENRVINTLLGRFSHYCEEENINFSFKVDLPLDLPVSDYDICIIVGNLLENALEASRFLENNKKITLEMMLHNE